MRRVLIVGAGLILLASAAGAIQLGGEQATADICIKSMSPQDECVRSYSGPAPLPVMFDARGSSHTDSVVDESKFTMLTYLWNFDDPDAPDWGPTGNSSNQMTGPMMGHVFEPTSFPDCGGTCKIFDVGLSVQDDVGNASTDTVRITVYSPDDPTDGWGGGETVCVSRSSDFAGCPAGSAQHTETGAFQSIVHSKGGAGFRRILFRSGQTWTYSGTLRFTNLPGGPGLVGSFGGGKATLNGTGSLGSGAGAGLNANSAASDWSFQDFALTGRLAHPFVKDSGGIGSRNFLVQRLDASTAQWSQIRQGSIGSFNAGPDTNTVRNTFFVHNSFGSKSQFDGTSQACHLFTGYGVFYAGNRVLDCQQGGQHNLRGYFRDIIISNNYLGPQGTANTGGANGKQVITMRDQSAPCNGNQPLCGEGVSGVVVQDNVIGCQEAACIEVGHRANPSSSTSRDYDIIIERNFLNRAGSDGKGIRKFIGVDQGSVGCVVNSDYVAIRNNLATGYATHTGVQGMGSCNGRHVAAYGNSCLDRRSSGPGNSYCVRAGHDWSYNNTLYAPNWPNNIEVVTQSQGANHRANLDNGSKWGGLSSCPFASCSGTITRASFEPRAGSPLVDAGVFGAEGMLLDQALAARPANAPDVGAIERGATSNLLPWEAGGGSGDSPEPESPEPDSGSSGSGDSPEPESPEPDSGSSGSGDSPEPESPEPDSGSSGSGGTPIPLDASALWSEDFESNALGAVVPDWYDTITQSAITQDDQLFAVTDVGGNRALSTSSSQTGAHSHLTLGQSPSWSAYDLVGRFMVTESLARVGVTAYSQYPSDELAYQLSGAWSTGELEIHWTPHDRASMSCADKGTAVIPTPNRWYAFRFRVEPESGQNRLRARVWDAASSEPSAWQAECIDSGADRPVSGTVGVRSGRSGTKYWDDLQVLPFQSIAAPLAPVLLP